MFSDFDQTVLEFVTEMGTPATLLKQSQDAYDPATGTVTAATDEIAVQGILMDLTLQSNGLSVKYGTLVEAGDKEFLMRPPHKTDPNLAPVSISPAEDRILIGGTLVYKIVTVKELNPTGSDPVLISLYLRR